MQFPIVAIKGGAIAMSTFFALGRTGLLLAKPVSPHDVDRVRDFVERMDGRNER
jgi:hypothetical protein